MTEQATYRIQVRGWIGERWEDWLDGMVLTHEGAQDGNPVTALTGLVADQVALRSLLARIWDLNLTVLSLTRCTTSVSRTTGLHQSVR